MERQFFSYMVDCKILFLAVGTGNDFQHFPADKNIVGIDISPKMLVLPLNKYSIFTLISSKPFMLLNPKTKGLQQKRNTVLC